MGLFDKLLGRKKKVEPKTEKVELVDPNDIWFTLPTISNEFPQTVETTKQTELDIFIHEDDYRQNEFLNISSLPLIEQEFAGIREIRENHSMRSGEYTLFKNCHVRRIIGNPGLTIPFELLKTIIKNNSVGQLLLNGNSLKNGFSIKTENTTYFGTLDGNIITELCISQWNEYTISEILEINKTFKLVFVSWYHCEIITNG